MHSFRFPIINNFVLEITRLLFVLDAWGFLPDGVTLTAADCVKRSNRTITVRWSLIGRKESPAQ
jgi:hypothetical protein